MTKKEFAFSLEERLKGIPKKEFDERLSFYLEIIDDKMEDGKTEEEAINELGNINDIASQILKEVPLIKLAKEKIKPKRKLTGLELTFLIIGAPVWGSILISILAVAFSLFISFYAVIISLWASFVSILVGGAGGAIYSILLFILKDSTAFISLSVGLILIGLSVFTFFFLKWVTKKAILLTKMIIFTLKKSFIKKED